MLFHSVAQRRRRPEIMDLPDLAPERHSKALRGLARINQWSGSAGLLWRPIRNCAKDSSVQPFTETIPFFASMPTATRLYFQKLSEIIQQEMYR